MARSFNGTNHLYTASPILSARPRSISVPPITMACWFNHTTGTGDVMMFLGLIGVKGDGYWLSCGASPGNTVDATMVSGGFTAFASAQTSTAATLNEWHHGCVVFTSTASRVAYLDGGGAVPNFAFIANPDPPTGISVGVLRADSILAPFNGALAEAGAWDVALTAAEVAALARGISPYFIRPTNLMGYWPLIGRTSPEMDVVGGNGLILVSAPGTADHTRVFYPVSGVVHEPAPPPIGVTVPVLTTTVTLHTPEIFAPITLDIPAQSIATAARAPAIIADLGFQVAALTVAVTAVTPASVNFEEEVIQEDEQTLEPANFKVRIVNFVGGDDLRISRTYTELPGGIIVNKAYLTIKRHAKDDTDAEAALQKQITSSEGMAGQITDATTTGGSIALYFDLTAAETATLTPLIPYHYDVQIISQAGAIYTCEKGVIVMQQGVTDATS